MYFPIGRVQEKRTNENLCYMFFVFYLIFRTLNHVYFSKTLVSKTPKTLLYSLTAHLQTPNYRKNGRVDKLKIIIILFLQNVSS